MLNWAQGALHVGRVGEAARLLELGRRLVDEADHERLRPLVELTELGLDLAAGRVDGLAERLRLFLSRPYRLPLAMMDAELYLARLRRVTGQLGVAEEGMRRVIAESSRVGAVWPLVPARTALAELLLATGRDGDGRAEAEAAVGLAGQKGLPLWGAPAARLLAATARP